MIQMGHLISSKKGLVFLSKNDRIICVGQTVFMSGGRYVV